MNKILLYWGILLLVCCDVNNKQCCLSESDFMNPPQWAKPKTWMHLMNGNMSIEGMTKDLESIADVGLGGVLLFDVASGIPEGRVEYNSSEHHNILKHAANECERLGLSFGFHNCAGWSASGGPWITPEESMKMLVESHIVVDGGKIDLQLPQPTKRNNFYKDIAILAYPALNGEIYHNLQNPIITSSDLNFDISIACDHKVDNYTRLKMNREKKAYIIFDYKKTVKISSIYLSTMNRNANIELWGSSDGKSYKKIVDLCQIRVGKNEWCFINSFKSVQSRFFKLVSDEDLIIKEVQLSPIAMIDDYLYKNCMGRKNNLDLRDTRIMSSDMVIKKCELKDLTNSFKNGKLRTNLPKGKWTIMRIGYTSTGAFNHPASNSGRGLECDKFSKLAVKHHFDSFSRKVIDNVRNTAPNALQYTEIDSYEMGGQNWTDGFEQLFFNKKGYEIRPFLPIILGRYMDSVDVMESVLADFRDVCCSLMYENYYKYFVELCNNNGIKCYIEPYGFGPFNELEVGGASDIPMGEFWMDRPVCIVESAVSSAHIYGKQVVSAESFTSQSKINWKGHPAMIKKSGDEIWKKGVNEFMLHRFAHQANTHVKPGMTMGRNGFHFDRTQTWWNSAGKDLFRYMARGSYMLQQGFPVVDILMFVGDGSPSSIIKDKFLGYKFDSVNSDVLCNRLSIKNKELVLPEGIAYKVLVLSNYEYTTIETLRRICQIAENGIPVIGNLPEKLIEYKNRHNNLNEMKVLIERIKECKNYYDEGNFDLLIETEKIEKDFFIHDNDSILMDFTHRRLSDGSDMYFVSNPDSLRHVFKCDFRVSGKEPELWFPMDGQIIPADCYKITSSGRTIVKIDLEEYESVFVVFRKDTRKKIRNNLYKLKVIKTEDISKDWSVKFFKEYGCDSVFFYNNLQDWSSSSYENIKYYSGTAVYSKCVNIDELNLFKSNMAILDMGNVYICAEIFVNGEKVSVKWIKPFTQDIYSYLKKGENKIEIRVTNQWTNRLIGDERYKKQDGGYECVTSFPPISKMPEWYVNNEPMPSGPRITFCTGQFYKKDDALIPAGLIGPVKINFIYKVVEK